MQVMFLLRRQEIQARTTGTGVKRNHVLIWDKSSISFADFVAMLRAAKEWEDKNPPSQKQNQKILLIKALVKR